jgi:hypothetical protein
VRCVAGAATVFFLGNAIGFLPGLALSQGAPQIRVQVLLQHRATDIPLPANLECVTIAGNPAPRPASTSIQVPSSSWSSMASLWRKRPQGAISSAWAKRIGGRREGGTM